MEAIGLLAGGVAHDFNNLLAIIVGFTGLAAKNLPSDHPVQQHLLEVEEAGRRGGELTRKLLAFSRKQIMQTRSLDVRGAVEDFSRLIRRIVGEDVEVELERAPDALVVQADPMQLEQVLMNLCANARQAMPLGGQLRIATREADFDFETLGAKPWARAGAFAEIAVSDTGVGMDEATMGRVFEPFFTTKAEGTGLGLAMVYGIVEQHGGFMHVESAPGRGTTFHAYLPRTNDGAPASNGPRSRARAEHGGDESVLVAEDEPALRALIAATLGELGYRVTATRDGEEASRAYEREGGRFDLVILDVVMPRLGAREAFERMRAVRPDMKVLFTTGYAPASTRLSEVLGGSAVPLLEKPFTPADLAAAVRAALDGPPRPA
jgi:CheY-like chemotaxis protein